MFHNASNSNINAYFRRYCTFTRTLINKPLTIPYKHSTYEIIKA